MGRGAGGAGGVRSGTGGGTGGMGGAGGGSVTKLSLCVLNAGGPADPCANPAELSYDMVPGGTQRMRSFRIDNDSTASADFQSITIADPDFSVQPVRYVEDPPNDPSQWLRVPVNLPSTRPPGESLFFEVTYTSKGIAEMLAPVQAVVTATVGGVPAPDVIVPIIGEALACPTGTAACDTNPANGCETNTDTTVTNCGACGNVCNLANGSSMCIGGVCEVATCNMGYANCNNMSADGCEINTTNDAMHCGSCDTLCDLPNASEACGASLCLIAMCTAPYANCDMLNPNGCEINLQTDVNNCGACNSACSVPNATPACMAGACAIGSCTGAFRDCDNMVGNGCEINTDNNVNNCGTCGNVCSFANASTTCSGGTCALGMCNAGYTNCDNMAANGCEINTAGDAMNCGACNNNCATTMVNANVGCALGTCQLVSCQSGYFNTDGNAQNGCECQFVGPDLPDDSFADTNCDGVDGDASRAIFVAVTGSDANPGTRQQPMFTINGALSKAVQQGKTHLYVSAGIYDGRVTLVNGISIYGGYNAQNNWSRGTMNIVTIQSNTISGGRMTAVDGNGLTSPMTLERLTIKTGTTTTAGTSNYAMYCNNCAGVTMRYNNITAGAGTDGTAGMAGTQGAAGTVGGNGGAGACDSGGTRTGGTAGGSSCARTGGIGGNGGAAGANNGGTGANGTGGTLGGSGGAGGDPGADGANGSSGANGTAGSNGAAGSGGSTTTNFWVGINGSAGNNGTNANGGGGGGGGGGQGGTFVVPGGGNGGGGGGGGGCGGTAGTGGVAGGGSFGLFIVNTNTMVLFNNAITSGRGGAGGAGGNGAAGGNGGGGGVGGTTCSAEVGVGGNGGAGGRGGSGGHGGGAAGGPSFAVYRVGSPNVMTTTNILNFGMGGAGGTSMGNAGTAGAAGAVF
ncbi:MAG TPA: hypothetical protein PK156_32175 [Polyangium sp.]|nr:hypothetical protein [Polyangium sp.]